jgi:hypothetical protein
MFFIASIGKSEYAIKMNTSLSYLYVNEAGADMAKQNGQS